MKSVCSILEVYDHDRSFQVYGFGGIPENRNEVDHCFPVNNNYEKPEVKDTDDMIEKYKVSLDKIKLSMPTLFTKVIEKQMQLIETKAKKIQKFLPTNYNILLIFTDGEIESMQETKNLIVDASSLPLSVIIIGIGEGSFIKMYELDSDDTPLRNSSQKLAARDMV